MSQFIQKMQESSDEQKMFYALLSATLVFIISFSLYFASISGSTNTKIEAKDKQENNKKEELAQTQSANVIQSLGQKFFSFLGANENKKENDLESKQKEGRKPYRIEI